MIAGPEKKSRVVIERERKLTAYHEAGHAIVIRPARGPCASDHPPSGRQHTISCPQEDVTFSRKSCLSHLVAWAAGRRAAGWGHLHRRGSDLQKASSIPPNMVTRHEPGVDSGSTRHRPSMAPDQDSPGRWPPSGRGGQGPGRPGLSPSAGRSSPRQQAAGHRGRVLLQYENMDAKTFRQVFTDPTALQPPATYQAVEAEAEQDAREEEGMAQIECVLGITRIEVDAIVNAANRTPAGGGGGRGHPPGGRPGAVGRVPYPPRL